MEEFIVFTYVWTSAVALLCYSYTVAASLPKAAPRLIVLLPVFCLLAILPLSLSSFHLITPSAFFLSWLCNFKLFLFCFGSGPLPRARTCLHFVLLASLPVDIKQPDAPEALTTVGYLTWKESDVQTSKARSEARECSGKLRSGLQNYHRMPLLAAKAMLVALAVYLCNYRAYLHPYLVWVLYSAISFFGIELALAIYAIPGWIVLKRLGLKLDAQFDEPCLATSLEDFWGRRWNLTVSRIFRKAVYNPVRSVCIPRLGPGIGSYPAKIATFAVSGLMHEAMYYYFTRVAPTWEVTTFFLIQGGCLVIEKVLKKRLDDSWRPCRVVSWFLTFGFMAGTAVPLLGIPLTRNNIDEKAIRETNAIVSFIGRNMMNLSRTS